MTALKYSTAALALLLASSMAYAEEATGTAASGTGTTASDSGSTTSGTTTSQSGTTGSDSGSGTATTDSGTSTTGSDTTTTTTTEVPKTDTDTSASSTTTGTTDTSASDTSTTGDAATTTTMTPSTGTMSNAMLASQFMGQTVYSTANESVGEINDLVLNKELDTVTAIIGVGGFLGIGEKDVAIPIDQLNAAKDENNSVRLTISASKEQLEAAPAFDRTTMNTGTTN